MPVKKNYNEKLKKTGIFFLKKEDTGLSEYSGPLKQCEFGIPTQRLLAVTAQLTVVRYRQSGVLSGVVQSQPQSLVQKLQIHEILSMMLTLEKWKVGLALPHQHRGGSSWHLHLHVNAGHRRNSRTTINQCSSTNRTTHTTSTNGVDRDLKVWDGYVS